MDGLVLDEPRYKAMLNGCDPELTAVEFKLLSYLATNPGRIASRDPLMERISRDRLFETKD